MNRERQDKIKELRRKLANLSADEREAIISRGLIATAEGRFLSLHNTLLCYLQRNGTIPSVVGGYRQWQKAGHQVIKGQHGFVIWFPVGMKDIDGDIDEISTYYTGTVFDISQTIPVEEKATV